MNRVVNGTLHVAFHGTVHKAVYKAVLEADNEEVQRLLHNSIQMQECYVYLWV